MIRLKVHNLPSDVNAGDLKTFFMNITPMNTFNLQRDKMGGETYALLTYNNPKDAVVVLQVCKNKIWSSKPLKVTRWNKPLFKTKNPIKLEPQSFDNFNRNDDCDSFSNEYDPVGQNMDYQSFSNSFQGDNWGNDQSFNLSPFRKRGYDQSGMSSHNSDHELNNLAEERRSINQRIMLLENSMRLTANNIQHLSDSGPSPKSQRFYPKFDSSFRGPPRGTLVGNRNQGRFTRSGPRERPYFRSMSPPIGSPASDKYNFDTTLVRKLIHCYVYLYGVDANAAIKELGDKKILTPGMVKYASGGKISVKRSSSDEEDSNDEDDPDVSLKTLKMVKNKRYWKKEMRRILDKHHTDHRFIDILKKEGPKVLQKELLQVYDENKTPTPYDNLPKCPDPPENYYKIRDYYLEMKNFYKSFTKEDFTAFNEFKRLFSSTPSLPKDYRRNIIYYVQVLGIYAIKDKKLVVKCLSRKTTVIVIKTEPTLILGFLCERSQKEVLDRNGECMHHIKLYLRPYEPAWCKKLNPKQISIIKKNINDVRKCQIRLWTQSYHEFYAPYIPLKDLKSSEAAGTETYEADEEDIAFIFDEAEEEYTVDKPPFLLKKYPDTKNEDENVGENGDADAQKTEDVTNKDNSEVEQQSTESVKVGSEVAPEVQKDEGLQSEKADLPPNEDPVTVTAE